MAVYLLVIASAGYGINYELKGTSTSNVIEVTTSSKMSKSSSSKKTEPGKYTIYFDDYGFDPNEATVPVGSIVTFKNISTTESLTLQEVDWDGRHIHPSAFNIDGISPGESASLTIIGRGVWQYQGNNNPSIRGVIGTGKSSSILPYQLPNANVTTGSLQMVYDIYGFMPNEVTVPIGTTVTLKNITNDSQPGPSLFGEDPDDDPGNPVLNIGIIEKQHSKSFDLDSVGTWHLENLDQPLAKALSQITAY